METATRVQLFLLAVMTGVAETAAIHTRERFDVTNPATFYIAHSIVTIAIFAALIIAKAQGYITTRWAGYTCGLLALYYGIATLRTDVGPAIIALSGYSIILIIVIRAGVFHCHRGR